MHGWNGGVVKREYDKYSLLELEIELDRLDVDFGLKGRVMGSVKRGMHPLSPSNLKTVGDIAAAPNTQILNDYRGFAEKSLEMLTQALENLPANQPKKPF